METNVNYTLVGAFVIVFTTFIVLAIIWLSSGFSIGQFSTYKVYMNESVGGLSVDSAVEFNGVNVGTVTSITIDQNNPRLVILLLNVKNSTPVTAGTKATLNSKGLTGIAYVALEDEGKDRTPLSVMPGEDYPIIKTSPSFMWRLDTGMRKLNESLSKVSNALQSLLDKENLRSIKGILFNVNELSRALTANSQQMTTILQNTAKASAQFFPLMQTSQSMVQMMTTQILPAANQALTNLDMITNNLTAVSGVIKQNPGVLIRGTQPPVLGPGEK